MEGHLAMVFSTCSLKRCKLPWNSIDASLGSASTNLLGILGQRSAWRYLLAFPTWLSNGKLGSDVNREVSPEKCAPCQSLNWLTWYNPLHLYLQVVNKSFLYSWGEICMREGRSCPLAIHCSQGASTPMTPYHYHQPYEKVLWNHNTFRDYLNMALLIF